MASVKNRYEYDDRRSVCSQEYLAMPCVRDFERPVYKTYSMPLKRPGQGHLLEKMWDEKRENRAHSTKKIVALDNLAILENNAKFVNNTGLKSQTARLGRHVELGLKRAEDDLEVKRNKLRNLIIKEDTALTYEYVDKAQKLADKLHEEKKKFAEEIIKLHEKEREEKAKERLEQLKRDNSEELRERISKVKTLEAAEIQIQQICEKKVQLQREEELNNFWINLQKKCDEERIKYEEEEEILRLTRIKEQREILNKQIIGKKMQQDEMKKISEEEATRIKNIQMQMIEEEENEKAYKLQKKKEQMQIQKAQLEERMLMKSKLQNAEKEFDGYYIKMLNEGIKKDNAKKTDTRAENRREAEYFKQQLVEIRAAKLEEEKEIERLRAIEVQKKEEVIRKNQMALKETRDKLHRETLETWKLQIENKQKLLKEEREAEKMYNQWSNSLLESNNKLDKLFVENMKAKEVERIKDVDWQQKYEEVIKNRGKEEDNEYRIKCNEEEAKKNKLIQSFGTCFGPPHPFTKVIRDNQFK